MASKFDAVDGMTAITTSSAILTADTNATGGWTEVSFTVTKGTKLSVDGDFVEILAIAVWSYVGGTTPGGPLHPVPDVATLTPSTTLLKENSGNLLLVGDKATGTADTGNYIEVESGQTKLKTS